MTGLAGVALPPPWLAASLLAPVAFTAVLLKQRTACAAALTAASPSRPQDALLLIFALLATLRAAALFTWATTASPVNSGLVFPVRLLLGVPLLVYGASLAAGALRLCGVARLCYAHVLFLGAREPAVGDTAPVPHVWPFTRTGACALAGMRRMLSPQFGSLGRTAQLFGFSDGGSHSVYLLFAFAAHPWDVGCALCALGMVILCGSGRDALPVALAWAGSYLSVALLEEGLVPPLALAPPPPAVRRGVQQQATLTWEQGRNPFYDITVRPHVNAFEAARRKLMAPFAVLRACCFWGSLILYGLYVNAVFYCVRNEKQRHAVLVPTTRVAARLVLWFCGFSITVSGWERLRAAQQSVARAAGSYVIVSNHVTYMDIMVCAAVFGPYAAAARHDLLSWPIVGPLARSWGVVGVVQSSIREKELAATHGGGGGASSAKGNGVNRSSGGGAMEASSSVDSLASLGTSTPTASPARGTGGTEAPPDRASSAKGAAAVLAARARLPGSGDTLPPVLVFPEATVTCGSCLVAFRSGAFVAGVPVLPVTLRYSRPNGESEAWVAPYSTGQHFWHSMCAWGKNVDVHILPLHLPNQEEQADAAIYAATVRRAMAADLGVPALDTWSVRDSHQLNADLARAAATGATVAIHKASTS